MSAVEPFAIIMEGIARGSFHCVIPFTLVHLEEEVNITILSEPP